MFNWNVFILELDVNLGVQVVQFPLIAGIFLIGFILFVLLLLNLSITNLLIKKKLSKTKEEINNIKTIQFSKADNDTTVDN
jgi:hypothetical protein